MRLALVLLFALAVIAAVACSGEVVGNDDAASKR
jgi:hypothetical protein